MSPFFEALESRELLSGNPVGIKAPPETIAADQAAITAAIAQLAQDKATWAATLRPTGRTSPPSPQPARRISKPPSRQSATPAATPPTSKRPRETCS